MTNLDYEKRRRQDQARKPKAEVTVIGSDQPVRLQLTEAQIAKQQKHREKLKRSGRLTNTCRRCGKPYGVLCTKCKAELVSFEVERELIGNPACYVYALVDHDNFVKYVGMTKNPYARLEQHWNDKIFSRMVVVYECSSRPVAAKRELELIRQFDPKYNRAGRVKS